MIVRKTYLLFLFLYILTLQNICHALYTAPDLENVPIERLIANLTTKYETNPRDNQILFALARTYAMAFASKSASVEVLKGKEDDGPWFGYEPKNVPYSAIPETMNNSELNSNYQEYLDKAIELHKKALSNDPKNALIKIGLAWCLQQKGEIDEAITGYRSVIEMAWLDEKEAKAKFGFSPFITEEASQYLIPLLNPENDKEEIAKLKKYQQHFDTLPRAMTPIVISLKENLELVNIKDKERYVSFDLDGSGIPKEWEWVNPNVGFLVFDKNQSGKINSALQLFGNVTFWLFWDNGYAALQSLDNNNDGQLTGQELNGLAIWQDINQNGKSEKGEVKSLGDWKIKKLNCDYTLEEDGTPCNSSGVLFANGDIKSSYDIYLKTKNSSIALTADTSNHD